MDVVFIKNKKNQKQWNSRACSYLLHSPIGYMSCLFHKKLEFVLTHLKSHSSMVHATQLMLAIVSWQAPQSNLWSIVHDRSVTLNRAWQPSTMDFLGNELIMDYNRRTMTISKYNAQTYIIDGFEKRPVPCLVLRWRETGAAIVGLT